jgi:glutamate 5-kinase
MRAAPSALLRLDTVPVINENDTVATSEIRFGDNDRLAARVAAMISADALILLRTSTASTAPTRAATPRPASSRDPEITAEIERMAGEAPPGYSSGGMVTKLAAARVAVGAGCRMAIANGRRLNPLKAIAEGAACSWFLPAATPLSARKRWIAGALKPIGALMVDAGALKALMGGRSLLPAGVTSVEGEFERGDAVRVLSPDGREAARGLSAIRRRRPPDHVHTKR